MTEAATTPDSLGLPSDFPDRLSPIVVKELRQGLRQASFVILFLFLQSVLAIGVVTSLVAVSGGGDAERIRAGEAISGFYFWLFALVVVGLQPLRGVASISSEVKQRTIELLVLTRLDSWRIVFGKWLSLVTQSALLLVGILPYLMLRYFLGGMNLFAELCIMFSLFLLGAMFCALGIGISALKSVILRTILVLCKIGMLVGLGALLAEMIDEIRRDMGYPGSSPITPEDWTRLSIALVLLIGYLTYSFLEFAATRIAPPAENRALRKRIVSILAMLFIPFLFYGTYEEFTGVFFFCVVVILTFAMMDALSESPMYASLKTRRIRPGCRPGWPDGAWFSLAMVFLTAFWCVISFHFFRSDSTYSTYYDDSYQPHEELSFATGLIAMAFAQPGLVIALRRTRITDPPAVYMISLLVLSIVGLLIIMVASFADAEKLVGFLMLPVLPSAGFLSVENPYDGIYPYLFGVAACYLTITAMIGRYATLNDQLSHKMHLPDPDATARAIREAAVCAERLRLPLRRVIWRGGAGELAGAGSGTSLDFQDHRSYFPGDDPRHINWAAYARTGNYTMKLFREEVSPTVEILFDVSPSMFLNEEKSHLICCLMAFVVEAARRDSASVTMHLLDGPEHHVLAAEEWETGAWTDRLHVNGKRPATPQPPALDAIPLRPGSLRVWISDLLFPASPAGFLRALSRQRGKALLLVPFSVAEADPDWNGICDFHDVEAGSVETRNVDTAMKNRYLATYRAHFSAWKEEATRHQVPFTRVSADVPLDMALAAEGVISGALEPAS